MKTTRTTAAVQPAPRGTAKHASAPKSPSAPAANSPSPPPSKAASSAGSSVPSGSPASGKPDKTRTATPASTASSPGKRAGPAHSTAGRSTPGHSAGARSATALKDPPGTSSKPGSKAATKSTTHAVPASGVDALHAIYERRAVREYTGVKPSRDMLKRLLDAAVQAPSAMDLQPWSFVVVQDAATLKRLSDHAKKLSLARMPSGSGLSLYRRELEDPKTDIFHGAGTLVVIVAKPGPWPGVEDCCLAGQNLMLAAHALGLGTCPIGYARDALNEPSFKRELGIPNDHSVAMAIVVGHKQDQPSPVSYTHLTLPTKA